MVPDPSASPELDRFQQFVSRHLASLPVTAPLPDAFGPWVSITVSAVKTALALGNVRGGEAVVDLLLGITHVGGGQGNLLASIKQDTTLLREEPLKTVMTYMAEAQRVGPGDERFRRFVDSGIQNLYRASSLASCLEEQAVVQFCIACAYLALNAPSDARSWFDQSVKSERDVLDALLKRRLGTGIGFQSLGQVIDLRANRSTVRPDRRRKILNAAYGFAKVGIDIFSYGITIMTRAAVDLGIRRQLLEALERFLHFVNAVEVSAGEASRRPPSVVLRLEAEKVPIYKGGGIKISRQHGDRWYLKEIPFDQASLTEA